MRQHPAHPNERGNVQRVRVVDFENGRVGCCCCCVTVVKRIIVNVSALCEH